MVEQITSHRQVSTQPSLHHCVLGGVAALNALEICLCVDQRLELRRQSLPVRIHSGVGLLAKLVNGSGSGRAGVLGEAVNGIAAQLVERCDLIPRAVQIGVHLSVLLSDCGRHVGELVSGVAGCASNVVRSLEDVLPIGQDSREGTVNESACLAHRRVDVCADSSDGSISAGLGSCDSILGASSKISELLVGICLNFINRGRVVVSH